MFYYYVLDWPVICTTGLGKLRYRKRIARAIGLQFLNPLSELRLITVALGNEATCPHEGGCNLKSHRLRTPVDEIQVVDRSGPVEDEMVLRRTGL